MIDIDAFLIFDSVNAEDGQESLVIGNQKFEGTRNGTIKLEDFLESFVASKHPKKRKWFQMLHLCLQAFSLRYYKVGSTEIKEPKEPKRSQRSSSKDGIFLAP